MGLLEYLKKTLGDTEGKNAYDKITADKENVVIVDSKKESKYVEKSKLDSVNGQVTDYKQQIKDRDKQLIDLQEKVKNIKNIEDVQKELEDVKKQNENITKDFETKLTKQSFDFTLEKTLNEANVHNVKTIKALLNLENVKLDGETFIGLNEQLEALKKSDSYLFKNETDDKGGEKEFVGGTGNIGGIHNTKTNNNKSFGALLGEKRAKEMSSTKDIEDKFFN